MTAYTVPLATDPHRWAIECVAAGHPRWNDEVCWCRNPDAQLPRTITEPAESAAARTSSWRL